MFTPEELRIIRGMADKRYNAEMSKNHHTKNEKTELYKSIAVKAQNGIINRTKSVERYRKSEDLV